MILYAIRHRTANTHMALYIEKDLEQYPYQDDDSMHAVAWGELMLPSEYSDLIFVTPRKEVADALVETGTWDSDHRFVIRNFNAVKNELVVVILTP